MRHPGHEIRLLGQCVDRQTHEVVAEADLRKHALRVVVEGKKARGAGKNPGPALHQALNRSESGQQASQNGEVVPGGVTHGVTLCVEAAPVRGVGGARRETNTPGGTGGLSITLRFGNERTPRGGCAPPADAGLSPLTWALSEVLHPIPSRLTGECRLSMSWLG